MTSVSFFHVSVVNNWGKCPWGGVLARFYGPGGESFELFFAQVVGNSPIKKLPRGMVRLGIDCYIIHLCSHLKNLYLKSYLFGSKIGINVLISGGGGGGGGLMRGEDYTRGDYTWSNTRVKENVSLSVERLIHGELIDREIWYFFVAMVQKLPKGMTFNHWP